MPRRVPLSQNKEFKPIKNAVIKEAINLLNGGITFEDEFIDQMENVMDEEAEAEPKNQRTNSNDMRYQYLRAKHYFDEQSEDYDPVKAIRLSLIHI